MCGFACLWRVADDGLAERMIGRIAHRGPDQLTVYRPERVPAVLAHCRLAIIGPADGRQPFKTDDTVLVANGEIYNHADLRAILGKGAFETASDSETILHLFRSGRLRWLSRLDGMFAFVLATPERVIAAQRVADHIGSEHFHLEFSAADLAAALPQVIYHLESADVDLVRSAVPTHFATTVSRRQVKAVLTGEGADELFAGYAYHHDYADRPRELADELTRSLRSMHNINLQRVDRITMAQGLEARTPFLDRDLIDFAQTIPASVKLFAEPGPGGTESHIRPVGPGQISAASPVGTESHIRPVGRTTIEKWILRKAVEDLLPEDLVWRKKAQFDEGTGTVDVLQEALAIVTERPGPFSREDEAAIYEQILREQFTDPDMILTQAGTWANDRVECG